MATKPKAAVQKTGSPARTGKTAAATARATKSTVKLDMVASETTAPKRGKINAPKIVSDANAQSETLTAKEPGGALRKKDLLERVVEATGAKKKDFKPIVEATLKLLGDALSSGDDLVLPPLGKAKVNRQKDLGSAEMLVIRLRRQDGKPETVGIGDETGED